MSRVTSLDEELKTTLAKAKKAVVLLEGDQEEARATKTKGASGCGVLNRRIQQCNELEDKNTSLSEEVKQ